MVEAAKRPVSLTIHLDFEDLAEAWRRRREHALDEGSLAYVEAFLSRTLQKAFGDRVFESQSGPETKIELVAGPRRHREQQDEPAMPVFSSEHLQAALGFSEIVGAELERQCPRGARLEFVEELRRELEMAICEEFMAYCWKERRRLKEAERDLEEALTRVTEAQERERKRLAFDIHDGPAQALASALLQLELLEGLTSKSEFQSELRLLRSLLTSALDEMRQSIRELRPRSLEAKNLPDKLASYVQDFKDKTNISVRLEIAGTNLKLTSSLQITVFRLIQEALSNIQKHADAEEVEIRINIDDSRVEGEITDDGRGFESEVQDEAAETFGLSGMKERVELLQGELNIQSRPGQGTLLRFALPVWRDN